MPVDVDVPGVGPVQCPDGMTHEAMRDAIERNFAPELHAARNREDVSAGMALSGVPIAGAYVPQAEAALRSIFQSEGSAPGESYSDRYAANLRRQQAQYKLAEQESPKTSMALKAGGAVAPFLLAAPLAGAGTALGVAPGMSVGGRIAAGGISGGGISAADAYLRGEDPLKAGVTGAGLGVALPAIGAGVGQAIRGYAPAAEQQLAAQIGRRAVEADFPLPAGGTAGTTVPPAMAARTTELGPTGFAGEHGANTRATLQGLVTEEGPARQRVTEAFEQRAAGQPQRIEDAITGAFGPRQDLAELTIGERLAQGLESSPLYDAFRSTSVYPTPQIRSLLPRLQEDGLLAEATRRMRLQGRPVEDTVFNTFQLGGKLGPSGPTVEVWDYVKRAIDGRIGVAQRQGDRDLVRIYTGLKQELDQAVANSNPEAAHVWRQARDTWASREALLNAREEGQQLWKRATRRDQLRQELMGMSMPERLAYREGARDSLAEMIDASVNGDTQVARMLRAPANTEKAMMLAQDPGDRKSTRLNSSHTVISYAVFCLKKKKKTQFHLFLNKKKKKKTKNNK